ncbi:response regulator transcription factor [Runella slithyformis]|uniref:Two component transcriptional regulator, AraC family n=1 Tax=Runella slithyformis (strain ATCC 29530 / DSM 19594 / LMG 11500 / NCIMB 11436 / LSU 4) TaxID=761193 RepID=A0A7U3ZLQ3_RUNSL|nr:response regulator [Runella slithyformis]AEI49506.1 two component transcriptional regulator, AraC family [Runella slithyformis DSM 19594]
MANILLVEDDAELKKNIVEYFEGFNHIVNSSSNGMEALDVLDNFLPDIIICDILMPKMNGLQFLSEKKKYPLVCNIPIIFITANSSVDGKLAMLAQGAIDYISKPFELKEIRLKVENLVLFGGSFKLKDNLREATQFSENIMFKIMFEKVLLSLPENPDITIGDVAYQMNMSVSTLQRGVNRYYNKNFTDLVRERKLKRAAELLSKTDKSINEISIICGFNTLSYFSKTFKGYFRISPKKYRVEKYKEGQRPGDRNFSA